MPVVLSVHRRYNYGMFAGCNCKKLLILQEKNPEAFLESISVCLHPEREGEFV